MKRPVFELITLIFLIIRAPKFSVRADDEAIVQKATLFSGTDKAGDSITLTDIVTDLGAKGFDNKAASTCFTGAWVFFDKKNFKEGGSEYVFAPEEYCLDLENIGGEVSSARFAGLLDARDNAITIYKEPYFFGDQKIISEDVGDLKDFDQKVASFIITGKSVWTAYSEPDFKGNVTCLYIFESDNFTPTFVPEVTTLKITKKTIRSLKLGKFDKCAKPKVGKRKSVTKPFFHGSSAPKANKKKGRRIKHYYD